ncbi:MAG: MmgE/PrpD family protein [Armatimonadota bacterium]|nr:MmgE/PrpD family protein [Armatimonadota bacterium]MDR7551313.1 MmgE/PrpD family protein [Armatimonadota bacterium]
MTPEAQLATFACTLRSDHLPEPVAARARLVVLDTLGAIIGGMPTILQAAEHLARTSPGAATILGTPWRAEPGHAAFLNGSAGTALELDEGHRFAAGHPAIHVVPAALAAAEMTDATGERFLAAVAAGYEVAARAGRAIGPLRPPLHPHGTWGTLGAAAATAVLLGAEPKAVAEALRLAAHYAIHTHYAAATEGATVRDTYAGASNLLGVLAARLALSGITGMPDLLRTLAPLAASPPDAEVLTHRLGDGYEVARGYFKMHAACRHLHGALDCLDEILRTHPVAPEEVVRVEVDTYAPASTFTGRRPQTRLAAKFSLPFAVATRLVTGTSSAEAFEPGALTPETFALAERVVVRERPEFTAAQPARRPTAVSVLLRDGRRLQAQVSLPRGEDDLAYEDDQVREKFTRLAGRVLGAEAAARAVARWQQAEAGPIRDLVALLTAQEEASPRHGH